MEAKILAIIVYSDSTNCDQLGRKSEHPLSITLGNIPGWRRQKLDSRAIIAYLPKMTSATQNNDFRIKKLQMFHNCLHRIFSPIVSMQQSQKGFEALVDGKIYWFIPFVAMCLVDWPEACAYCMTYNSYNCQHPCHFCLVKRENLNNMQLHGDQIILRTHTTMQQNCRSI